MVLNAALIAAATRTVVMPQLGLTVVVVAALLLEKTQKHCADASRQSHPADSLFLTFKLTTLHAFHESNMNWPFSFASGLQMPEERPSARIRIV
jgi:hypothetical protein